VPLPTSPADAEAPAESVVTNLAETPPAETAAPAPTASRWGSIAREIVETVILTVIIYLVVNAATGRFRVEGESMAPTLHPEEYVLIDKVSYLCVPWAEACWGRPERGDIVVFHYPLGPERDFIKRVIGLPGETVTINNGVVSVNGQPLTEPYIAAPTMNNNTWTLGPDQLFVMGDNRNNSSDSRSWGPLDKKWLVGRALLVYWPADAWQIVPHHDYGSVAAAP
jgi:signal peptidase I